MDGTSLAAFASSLNCPTRSQASRLKTSSFRRQSTIRRLSTVIQKALFVGSQEQEESADNGAAYLACRPESLHHLCSITKFSKKELQIMYRGFKQGCPNGAVSLEQFKDIYAQFFPQGESRMNATNTNQYALYIFNTFDKDKNGRISFEEFVTGLSTLSRGTIAEKLCWIFELYDVDGDGVLTKKDMERIMTSVYSLMGMSPDPPLGFDTVQQHIDFVFRKIDKDEDGVITRQEFLEVCQSDDGICKSIQLFDTYLA